ncbi:hypothetical protein U2P60_04300 [Brucella sp. H1_1004]|uniref:hypothetical protein n=1 Tax=Brucella sp. H1_1004 TaxID=3110109 RepID=UPI0039B37863
MNKEHLRPVDGKWHPGPSDYTGQAERKLPDTSECFEKYPYHNELQCKAYRIHYDFSLKSGTLFIESGACTDMHGCIALFERIDPNVSLIRTFAGGDADTIYRRGKRRWSAFAAGAV